MIVLKTAWWSNFFSYGDDNELDLDSERVTQIIGDNGKGKTSILLILQELLYNKNSKGIKKADIPNRYTETDGYSGGLDFEVNGRSYLLTITRKGVKINVELLEDGEDISAHTAPATYKKLNEILGMDFPTFCQLVYQSSTDSLAFLTATDTTRKAFLGNLLGLDEYQGYEKSSKQIFSQVKTEHTSCLASVNTIKGWLKAQSNLSVETENLKNLNSENLEELRDQIAEIRSSITHAESTNRRVVTNNERIAHRDTIGKLIADGRPDYVPDSDYFEDVRSSIESESSIIYEADRIIGKLSKLGNECPTCLSEIDTDKTTSVVSYYTEAKSKSEKELKRLKAQESEVKQGIASVHNYDKWKAEFDSIVIEDIQAIDISKQTRRMEAKKKELSDITAENRKIETENLAIQKRNAKREAVLEQREKYKIELVEKEVELKKLDARLTNVTVLKKAFSPKGLVAYKIESMVKDLEDLINEYLQEFSDGRFTLTFAIEGEKLNIDLTDDGVSVNINTLSTGELARVNTSTLLAIRKLLSSLSSSRLNLLFLDEVLNVLDEEGRQKLIEVLNKEEYLNTFIVSHGWAHPLVSKLYVEKDNNISRVTADG